MKYPISRDFPNEMSSWGKKKDFQGVGALTPDNFFAGDIKRDPSLQDRYRLCINNLLQCFNRQGKSLKNTSGFCCLCTDHKSVKVYLYIAIARSGRVWIR